MKKLKKYTLPIVLLCFFNHYCYAGDIITDHFTFKDYEIALLKANNNCQLSISSSTVRTLYPLALTTPCHFLRGTNAEPQNYSYPDVNIEATFIIFGNSVTQDERKTWKLPPDMLCGMKGQGLIFDGAHFRVSKKELSNILLCKDKGTNEKNYWMLSR